MGPLSTLTLLCEGGSCPHSPHLQCLGILTFVSQSRWWPDDSLKLAWPQRIPCKHFLHSAKKPNDHVLGRFFPLGHPSLQSEAPQSRAVILSNTSSLQGQALLLTAFCTPTPGSPTHETTGSWLTHVDPLPHPGPGPGPERASLGSIFSILCMDTPMMLLTWKTDRVTTPIPTDGHPIKTRVRTLCDLPHRPLLTSLCEPQQLLMFLHFIINFELLSISPPQTALSWPINYLKQQSVLHPFTHCIFLPNCYLYLKSHYLFVYCLSLLLGELPQGKDFVLSYIMSPEPRTGPGALWVPSEMCRMNEWMSEQMSECTYTLLCFVSLILLLFSCCCSFPDFVHVITLCKTKLPSPPSPWRPCHFKLWVGFQAPPPSERSPNRLSRGLLWETTARADIRALPLWRCENPPGPCFPSERDVHPWRSSGCSLCSAQHPFCRCVKLPTDSVVDTSLPSRDTELDTICSNHHRHLLRPWEGKWLACHLCAECWWLVPRNPDRCPPRQMASPWYHVTFLRIPSYLTLKSYHPISAVSSLSTEIAFHISCMCIGTRAVLYTY